jgi:hypothetical protein
MNKRTLVTVLVGLNLFLVVTLIFTAYEPPAARAQAIGNAGNFVMLTGEVQESTDVVYLFDLAQRNLHVLTGRRAGVNAKLVLLASRSLARDLRR